MIDKERLLKRFLRYVRIDTTAREGQADYPSSPGQLELGRLLRDELLAIGLSDALQTDKGIVLATVPATVGRKVPVVALNSHVDTSPETTGKGVDPQVIRDYRGGDIQLAHAGKVIRVADCPELAKLVGATIITTDGRTLLGGDDKAGVAVIMETAAWLVEHPEIEHGTLRVCFTCDEEIGHGVDHVDLKQLGADVCYTLDGQGAGEIDVETFSADLATVAVRGVNIHPAIAKGRMVNAVRVAADFIARLPVDSLSPETTSDREGFLHPYILEAGGVAEVSMRILLRDFDTANLAQLAARLRVAADESQRKFPGSAVEVKITPQYRNMADGLAREPRAVEFAKRAFERLARPYQLTIIRGGTDGSRFTELGLPTPNLSTGEHILHSPLEWACLEEMVQAAEMLVELVQVWASEV